MAYSDREEYCNCAHPCGGRWSPFVGFPGERAFILGVAYCPSPMLSLKAHSVMDYSAFQDS